MIGEEKMICILALSLFFSQNMSLVRKVQNGNLQECIQGPVKRSTGNKHVSKAS